MSNDTGTEVSYLVEMACTNCGWKGRKGFARGKEVPRKVDCPNCGCLSLIKTFGGDGHSERNWFAETCDVFFNGRPAK